MSIKMKPSRKPNLMVLLTFSVGLSVILTGVAQAAEPLRSAVPSKSDSDQRSWTEQWLRSLWSLDLAGKIKNWKPKVSVDSDGEGVKLSHPFGNHGPALRLSTSIPERAQLSLRAGGDNRVGSFGADVPAPYLFLQKRW
jgi:hypothetical protein